MPVTVTVWVVFQLELVNVNWAGDTVASPVSGLATSMTTLLPGWLSRTTVNVSVPPASVTDADVFDSVTPADTVVVVVLARFPDESNFINTASVSSVGSTGFPPGWRLAWWPVELVPNRPTTWRLPDPSTATELPRSAVRQRFLGASQPYR